MPAHARVVTDESERRGLLAPIAKTWNRKDLETMVAQSPLVEAILEPV